MEWYNVTYRNRIVQNLSGDVQRGEFVAIMGPSGSGKTYTLDILSGRRTALIKGRVKIDGEPLTRHNVKRICLVQQTDAFFEGLTLLETLNYAANLRLDSSLSRTEKREIVEKVIKTLDLESCSHIKCGDGERYGLSGGERKRLNLACEILSNPEIILLDEPTSGLDALAAKKLILFLRDFAVNENKIVICSIHQPSSFIFQCFHKVLILYEGSQAFFGSPQESIRMLASQGFICPPHYNAAEFFLEVLSDHILHKLPDNKIKTTINEFEPLTSVTAETNEDAFHTISAIDDNLWTGKEAERKMLNEEVGIKLEDESRGQATKASYWQQFLTLGKRSFAHRWKRILNKYTAIEVISVTLFMCIVWFNVGDLLGDVERRKAQLYFLTQYWAFHAPYKVMFSFPSEKQVVRRERASGWYSLSAYYLAKCFVEIPLICVYPIAMISVIYWVSGMTDIWAFLTTVFILLATVVEFNALGVAIGCTTMVYQHTLTLCAISLLMMLMFGGFYSRQLPLAFRWTRYLSLFNYTWYALINTHFHSHSYYKECQAIKFNSTTPSQPCWEEIPPNEILTDAGVDLSLAPCFLVMAGATVAFYSYGYLALRYFNKPNKEK